MVRIGGTEHGWGYLQCKSCLSLMLQTINWASRVMSTKAISCALRVISNNLAPSFSYKTRREKTPSAPQLPNYRTPSKAQKHPHITLFHPLPNLDRERSVHLGDNSRRAKRHNIPIGIGHCGHRNVCGKFNSYSYKIPRGEGCTRSCSLWCRNWGREGEGKGNQNEEGR